MRPLTAERGRARAIECQEQKTSNSLFRWMAKETTPAPIVRYPTEIESEMSC